MRSEGRPHPPGAGLDQEHRRSRVAAHLRRRLAHVAAAILFAAGIVAPAVDAVAQQPARNLLYRVEGSGGATVYLLGSIHFLTPDAYPLASSVETAYADAERVVFEVNLDSLHDRAGELVPRALLFGRNGLRDLLPAEVYARLERAVRRYPQSGVDMTVLNRFEPWLVALMLNQLEWARIGLRAEDGIDVHFEARAERDGKGAGALESVDFQLSLMDGLTLDQQVEQLRQTLDDLPGTQARMDSVTAAWRAGDAEAMDRLISTSLARDPRLYARMLTDRNAAWVPLIEEMLRGTEDVLVVVGAAHLVGEHSVVAMLRDRGHVVEQM